MHESVVATIAIRGGHNGRNPGKRLVGESLVLGDNFTETELKMRPWYLLRKHAATNVFSDDGSKTIRYMHVVVYEQYYGPVPDGLEIDHADRNPLNNLPGNLRAVTRSKNAINCNHRGPANTSGYRGVCRFRNKWQATLASPGSQGYIGRFCNIEDAARAVNARWRELYPDIPIPNPSVELEH